MTHIQTYNLKHPLIAEAVELWANELTEEISLESYNFKIHAYYVFVFALK